MLRTVAHTLDAAVSEIVLRVRPEAFGVVALVFHGVNDDSARRADDVDPFQPVDVAALDALIDYFTRHGYRFVAPAALPTLEPTGRYAVLTFDDGYANNLRLLPLVRRHHVPATVFVSARHVIEGKAFWWDVVYRERRRRGTALAAIRAEQRALKTRHWQEIDAHLRREFGPAALDPVGEHDRPLTPAELTTLAAEPQITIGNHTVDHAILPLYDDDEVAQQIRTAGELLATRTGRTPVAIAYPDGAWDERIVRIAGAVGMQLGFTAEPVRARAPVSAGACLRLGRYFVPATTRIVSQCRRIRASYPLARWWRARRAGGPRQTPRDSTTTGRGPGVG